MSKKAKLYYDKKANMTAIKIPLSNDGGAVMRYLYTDRNMPLNDYQFPDDSFKYICKVPVDKFMRQLIVSVCMDEGTSIRDCQFIKDHFFGSRSLFADDSDPFLKQMSDKELIDLFNAAYPSRALTKKEQIMYVV